MFVVGMAVVNAQDSKANAVITLERTACFGSCPIYTVSILEDGTVLYNGERFVSVTGEQTSTIDPTVVAQMVKAFEDAGYFDWDTSYENMTITDMPTVTTSVTHDGKTHQIARYAGDYSAPLALPFLEAWIDQMVNSQLWTGVQPNITNISNGTDTPVATLQRTECFGMCPVYSIAAFADGTVVYTRVANVKPIGVSISKLDAAVVASIGSRAQGIGYFNWNDNYENRVMTDQATVITSVRTDDQYKQIVRYGGDSNAPVGVTWIEEAIDQLAAAPAN